MNADKNDDLGRMYSLVSRIPDGLGVLKHLLENHIAEQGHVAIEKLGDEAANVSGYQNYQIFEILIDLNLEQNSMMPTSNLMKFFL